MGNIFLKKYITQSMNIFLIVRVLTYTHGRNNKTLFELRIILFHTTILMRHFLPLFFSYFVFICLSGITINIEKLSEKDFLCQKITLIYRF